MRPHPSRSVLRQVLRQVPRQVLRPIHRPAVPRGAAVLGAVALLAGACKGGEDSASPGLPPVDTGSQPVDTGEPFFPVDTAADTGFDLSPVDILDITHTGVWSQSPIGGPYTALTGQLEIVEILNDDDNQPWCRVTFALTGLKTNETCPTCDIGYLVEYYVVQEGPTEEELADDEDIEIGGLDDCYSPDLPENLDRWHMGWSELEQTVYFNYYDSGFWLPWYDTDDVHDDISFVWEMSMGFFVPEEDD